MQFCRAVYAAARFSESKQVLAFTIKHHQISLRTAGRPKRNDELATLQITRLKKRSDATSKSNGMEQRSRSEFLLLFKQLIFWRASQLSKHFMRVVCWVRHKIYQDHLLPRMCLPKLTTHFAAWNFFKIFIRFRLIELDYIFYWGTIISLVAAFFKSWSERTIEINDITHLWMLPLHQEIPFKSHKPWNVSTKEVDSWRRFNMIKLIQKRFSSYSIRQISSIRTNKVVSLITKRGRSFVNKQTAHVCCCESQF